MSCSQMNSTVASLVWGEMTPKYMTCKSCASPPWSWVGILSSRLQWLAKTSLRHDTQCIFTFLAHQRFANKCVFNISNVRALLTIHSEGLAMQADINECVDDAITITEASKLSGKKMLGLRRSCEKSFAMCPIRTKKSELTTFYELRLSAMLKNCVEK